MAKQKLKCPPGLLKDVWKKLENKFIDTDDFSELVLVSAGLACPAERKGLLIGGLNFRDENCNPDNVNEDNYLHTIFAWLDAREIKGMYFDVCLSNTGSSKFWSWWINNDFLVGYDGRPTGVEFGGSANETLKDLHLRYLEARKKNIESHGWLKVNLPRIHDGNTVKVDKADIITTVSTASNLDIKHNGFSVLAGFNSILFGINVCLALRAYNLIPSGNILLDTLPPYLSFGAALVASSYINTEDTSAKVGYATTAALLLSVMVQGYNALQRSGVTSPL